MLLASGALLVLASGSAAAAADDTFDTCDSAFNYGANTAWFYVSASMNRASCDPAMVDKAEATLARAFKRQKIAPQNGEALKVCFYAGLYDGYVGALADELGDCNRPLGLASVARAAVAVFTAMETHLAHVDDFEVDIVFDDVFGAPGGGPAHACDAFVRAEVPPQAGLDELCASVCWND